MYAASTAVDNALPAHETGYDRHDIRVLSENTMISKKNENRENR